MLRSTNDLPSLSTNDLPSLLPQHIQSCRRSAGKLHLMRCFEELVYETVAPRLVTTVVLLFAAMLLISALV